MKTPRYLKLFLWLNVSAWFVTTLYYFGDEIFGEQDGYDGFIFILPILVTATSTLALLVSYYGLMFKRGVTRAKSNKQRYINMAAGVGMAVLATPLYYFSMNASDRLILTYISATAIATGLIIVVINLAHTK